MAFDPAAYGEQVAAILALDGNGERLMPLAEGRCSSPEALKRIQSAGADLFRESRAPEAALAGLYLYFSCLEEAHSVAQNVDSPESSYWHGIMHRQEPDPGNAAYWFRRVGKHPVHDGMRRIEPGWDPFAFIDTCERARRQPGSELERKALELQRAEWQLLFDHCARS